MRNGTEDIWPGAFEPDEVETLRAAFEIARVRLTIDRDTPEAADLAARILSLYSAGISDGRRLVEEATQCEASWAEKGNFS